MDDLGEQKVELSDHSESESETSESSTETETTQVSNKKSKTKTRRTMQSRILSRLTKLMEQLTAKTTRTNRHNKRRHAASNSSTEELTDTSSLDSEVLLNLQDNTTEPTLNEDTRNHISHTATEVEPEHTTTKPTKVKQNKTSSKPKQEHGFATRPHIMPDKFDGSADWVDYETHFDSCRTINNWTDEESVRYLSASLRGPALRLLNERRQTKWTYHELITKLSMRFSSSKQAESYLLEPRGRKRRQNESFQELGRCIRELVTKAYPGFDSDGSDEAYPFTPKHGKTPCRQVSETVTDFAPETLGDWFSFLWVGTHGTKQRGSQKNETGVRSAVYLLSAFARVAFVS